MVCLGFKIALYRHFGFAMSYVVFSSRTCKYTRESAPPRRGRQRREGEARYRKEIKKKANPSGKAGQHASTTARGPPALLLITAGLTAKEPNSLHACSWEPCVDTIKHQLKMSGRFQTHPCALSRRILVPPPDPAPGHLISSKGMPSM